jgi:hypothetical protein
VIASGESRWKYLVSLDEELLLGSVVLSEWAVFVVREADTAFVMGAELASILTSVSAIETHLRAEYGHNSDRLVELINRASIDDQLRAELHDLRRCRNRWVHVESPDDDSAVLENPGQFEEEVAVEAARAARLLRLVLYHNQGT